MLADVQASESQWEKKYLELRTQYTAAQEEKEELTSQLRQEVQHVSQAYKVQHVSLVWIICSKANNILYIHAFPIASTKYNTCHDFLSSTPHKLSLSPFLPTLLPACADPFYRHITQYMNSTTF